MSNPKKPYHFKGTGWFEAISDAWQNLSVYRNVLKVEDDLRSTIPVVAEVAGGGNSRLSAKVRRATVNSLKRKEEEAGAGGDSMKWA